MKKKIKVIEFTVDEELALGLTAISLVDEPAIESNFIALSSAKPNDKHRVHFSFSGNTNDTEKRMLYGPILVPDKLILRVSATGEEYYMKMSRDTVRRLAHSYQTNYLQGSTKIDHELAVSGCLMVELWIKDFDSDKSVGFGMDEPVGTWFGGMHIGNDKVWEGIKDGTHKGFSVEVDLVFKDMTEVEVDIDVSTNEDELVKEVEQALAES